MAAFKVLETQFQMFIKSRIYLDDEFVVMTRKLHFSYTLQLAILEFRDTMIQHMEYVKKSIDKRAPHKREHDTWVNERKMQTIEDKTTRAKNIEHTTSLIANNDNFKAQLQEKGFAIAALKNELRKLTGNSVNTKFAKSSILGKLALQLRRNQSIVRQPNAFNHSSLFAKECEYAVAKPHHMIALALLELPSVTFVLHNEDGNPCLSLASNKLPCRLTCEILYESKLVSTGKKRCYRINVNQLVQGNE
ncbi:hypothetical protein Tco_0577906 [Tanacetum coccineum]